MKCDLTLKDLVLVKCDLTFTDLVLVLVHGKRFRITSPRVPIDLGCASVNRNSWGGDPESLRANRSAYYPQDQSLFVYISYLSKLEVKLMVQMHK